MDDIAREKKEERKRERNVVKAHEKKVKERDREEAKTTRLEQFTERKGSGRVEKRHVLT